MLNARVTFTKEFINKTKGENMSSNAKSKIYFERLADLDSIGELQKATKRAEVAKLVGFTNKRKGYIWVTNAIRRGRITETVLSVHGNRNVCEYHYGRDAKNRWENRGAKKVAKQEIYITPGNSVAKLPIESANHLGTVTLTFGDKSIKCEGVTADYVVHLINGIK